MQPTNQINKTHSDNKLRGETIKHFGFSQGDLMLREFNAERDGKIKGSWLLSLKMSILQHGALHFLKTRNCGLILARLSYETELQFALKDRGG